MNAISAFWRKAALVFAVLSLSIGTANAGNIELACRNADGNTARIEVDDAGRTAAMYDGYGGSEHFANGKTGDLFGDDCKEFVSVTNSNLKFGSQCSWGPAETFTIDRVTGGVVRYVALGGRFPMICQKASARAF